MKQEGEFPLGNVPMWVEDGLKLVQSNAILRMLAIRTGYYHDDPLICWSIDSLMDYIEDITPKKQKYMVPIISGQ